MVTKGNRLQTDDNSRDCLPILLFRIVPQCFRQKTKLDGWCCRPWRPFLYYCLRAANIPRDPLHKQVLYAITLNCCSHSWHSFVGQISLRGYCQRQEFHIVERDERILNRHDAATPSLPKLEITASSSTPNML